ncbi:hypothetical protein V9K67_22940 [Paraflavisolibacter sp. H34]|uniref:hypothetical protein n=1 Tax=Huijunlia imazamoxiresistens TaxID=3127457 RepID=UPI0030179AAB
MNTRFSFRTNGIYVRRADGEPDPHFLRFFMEDPERDQADNYLLMGTLRNGARNGGKSLQEGAEGTERIDFHIDDNDGTEVFWYGSDESHCIVTVYNEGQSVLFTRTHPERPKQTFEFTFQGFENGA